MLAQIYKNIGKSKPASLLSKKRAFLCGLLFPRLVIKNDLLGCGESSGKKILSKGRGDCIFAVSEKNHLSLSLSLLPEVSDF
jgi:hypothetical protein